MDRTRNHFLARAALAANQHRGIALCDARNEILHLANLPAVAHESSIRI